MPSWLADERPFATQTGSAHALTLVGEIDAMIAVRDSCLFAPKDAKHVMSWAATPC